MDPFLGEIRPVPYNFAPRNWAFCNGQILPIAQNTALFSLLGTTFGGNGQTTFALPNLQGRIPIGSGQGSGLSSYSLGEIDGVEGVLLNLNQVPPHNHIVNATAAKATSTSPVDNFPAAANVAVYTPQTGVSLAPDAVGAAGGNPHENLQPYTVISYIICMSGIYPSRN